MSGLGAGETGAGAGWVFGARLGALLAELDPRGGAHLEAAARAVMAALGRGDICADLKKISGAPLGGGEPLPGFDEWVRALRESAVVGGPGDFKPLILDGSGRLYLYRCHMEEQFIAGELLRRASMEIQPQVYKVLGKALKTLFGGDGETDLQRVAALNCAARGFSVISGGPGTGKTYTVARAVALLLMVYGAGLRVAICAPTGKAAGRLGEALKEMVETLNCPEEVKAVMPGEVFTIHRLLGFGREGGRFLHGPRNRLPLDVVVVDEASMVDVSLMAALLGALSPQARVILSGDRDQLASVEAGAVLGDVTAMEEAGSYSPDFAAFVEAVSGDRVSVSSASGPALRDCLTILTKSRRFGDESKIGRAARLLSTDGGAAEAYSLISGGQGEEFRGRLREAATEKYSVLARAKSPGEALASLRSFRILCAVRKGPRGVEAVNEEVRRTLFVAGLIEDGEWYRARPVMITANDYTLGLMNGDVGVAFPDGDGNLKVWFDSSSGQARSFSPARLSGVESVFAMTVHKSQGSEFDEVLLVLPDADAEILTRELLYTAITRARRDISVLGGGELFAAAAARVIERSSGLRDALA